jgi:protein gp37
VQFSSARIVWFTSGVDTERLPQPHGRKAPTVYFVNSMSDLFHESVPDEFIDRVIAVCRATPQHTYQILTKRAERLPAYFGTRNCPPNVWLGVSVEDRRYGLPRIDHLRHVKASVRFLSVEPLLEDIGTINLRGIHWVIVGGESGPKARPMRPEWVDGVRREVIRQQVAFFFKQWGAWGADGVRRDKKRNGRLLHGRRWDQFPVAAQLG